MTEVVRGKRKWDSIFNIMRWHGWRLRIRIIEVYSRLDIFVYS